MAVHLHTYGVKGVKVSKQWLVTLQAADKQHVDFTVNSGARTRAEQEALIHAQGCWSPSNPHGAACPWFKSNHVIKGHANHALDVDSRADGENHLQRWLNSHRGVSATNPVPGEPWHLEINRAGLFRLYLKYRRHRVQRTSSKGREFIAREEGVVLHAYNDPVGHCTVGVGHLLHKGNCTRADFLKWGSSTPTNPLLAAARRKAVMLLFAQDLKPFEAVLRAKMRRRMLQHRFDAAVSLAFNIGTGAFAGSTVAQRIKDKAPLASIEEAWLRWKNAGGHPILLPRRQREVKLFKTGRYS